MTDTAPAYAQALDQLRAERDQLRAQLEAVTAERDEATRRALEWRTQYDQTAALLHDPKCRIADLEAASAPRAPTDLEVQTGPVAFERNQLRDENLRLREEVATLAAELDGTRSRLTMTTRDLDAAERAVAALKTVAHAIVNAVAKGAP